ncbi:lymphocyte antigen 75-like [Patiria miniata]|uniref:Macrophage mannose receptor 1-like n=1 Tax=Patiria miniata TaxID=46514 RepID=A0A914BLM8_PATMI|nr:lymphocyte antigen 75-like [Patiria miniata]
MKWFLLSCLFIFLPTVLSQRCPQGWSLYQDNCFRLFTDWKSVNDARIACQQEGGDLAIITSIEMNTFLADFTEAAGAFAWIGLNDQDTEGSFKWIDGTPLDPALNVLWGSSAPNNDNNQEDCVVLRDNRVWNDVNCLDNKNRICQRPNDAPLKCDEANGWVSAAGKCHKYMDLANSWDDARRYCQERDGDLISVQTDEEQNFALIQARLNQESIWIGATDKISNSAGLYTWPDGSSVGTVTYWAPGQPDNQFFSMGGNCVGILDTSSNGEWSTAPCTSQRKFICEKDEGTCPTGWRIHGGQCYQFNTYSAMSWTDAKHTCEVQGTFLASIFSEDENSYVIRQFDDLESIGITDVWIGISDYNVDGQFAWAEGAAVSYTKWNVGMPFETPNQPDCGTIYLGDSTDAWSTTNCFLPRSFVCKTPVGQPVTPLNPISGVGSCPTGWNLFGDYCYFIDTTGTTFNDAETMCKAKGSKLVSIHTAEEQSYLSLRTSMMNANLWIGLHDRSNEGNFEWLDSTPLDFTNWNTGEPNDYGDGEDCVHLRPDELQAGTWNDQACDANYGYICKKDKACEVLDTVSTDDNFSYRYHPSQANVERVEFRVKAGSDVHVSLSAASSDQPAMYEIIIGGWTNGNSAIRRCGQCTNEVYISTPNFLSANEFRGFWINYDLGTGKLDVGKEGQGTWFMTWTDPQPLDVKYVGYSTGFGFAGEFEFCNLYAGVASTPAPRPTPAFDARCGLGWEYDPLTGQCYWFAFSDYRTWADAREQCMLGGGDLISIVSAQEQTYLNARMVTEREPHVWIGANDIATSGGWVWSDGAPFKFLNWNAGEPNEYGSGENCAELLTSNGRWNDIDCAATQGYVCKKNGYLVTHFTVYPNAYLPDSDILVLRNVYPEECAHRCVMETSFDCRSFDYDRTTKDCMLSDTDRDSVGRLETDVGLDYYQIVPGVAPPTPPATLAPGYRCPDGWSGYGDYCYQAQPGDGTWEEALRDCRTMGADLMSIHDMNENDYIVSIMQQKGLTGQVWSGMSDTAVFLTFEWSDRSPVTFTHWEVNEPNNYEGKNEDCVEVYTSGRWNDQDCEDRNHYICKQMKQNLGPTQFPITPSGCDAGWVAFEASCYKIEGTPEVSWDQAKSDCESMGAHLIVVNERFEQSFMSSQLGLQNGQMFWIGMSEGDTRGSYQWTNGAPITYTHWDRGQPDDSRGSCVAVTSGSAAGLWNVDGCNAGFSYICEAQRAGYTPAPVVTDPPVPTSPSNQGCPVGWVGWGSNCFKVYDPADKKSFWDAEAYCNSVGANLASFHSTEEEVYFVKNAGIYNEDTFWIGLHDTQNEGGFEWTDGSVLQYTNWNYGEPNNAFDGGEDCAEMFFSGAGWNDQNCDDRRGWVCKTSRVLGCSDGWMQYEDKCYSFRPQMLSHDDARAACLDDEADLVIISSSSLNTWLTTNIASTGMDHWIGLHDLTDEGQFEWVDGTPLDPVLANFWDAGQPDNYGAVGEDCTLLRTDGRWNDDTCTYNKAHICQRPIVLCPDGWKLHKGRCYRFMTTYQNWNDAKMTCQGYQGDLAKIDSVETNAWAGKYVSEAGDGHYIGLHDLSNEGRFMWTDGSQLDPSLTSLWSGGAPDDFSDGEDCVVLKPNGKWDDNRCTYKRFYVCQKIGASVCPTGWTAYQGDCFIFKTGTPLAWNDARADCQVDLADLVVVTSLDTNTWLAGFVTPSGKNHWIGLHDVDREGNFFWVDGTTLTDSSPLVSLWDTSAPNNIGQGEDCVVIQPSNQKWGDLDCSLRKLSICMRPYGEIPFTTAAPEYPPCPTDDAWILRGDSCYYFSSVTDAAEGRRSWDGAEQWCNQKGGNLISIHGMDEQDFVNLKVEASNVDSHWIGIREYEIKGVYSWSDGTPVDFDFWAPGEPNDYNGEEQCAETYNGDGKWNDNNCGIDRNFICRKHVNSVTPVTKPTTPAPTGYCPVGAAKFDNRCYVFIGKDEADRKSWEDAREACETSLGSRLAIIHSAPLQSFLTTKLKGLDYRMWIGLSDLTSNSQFRWIDGTALDYTNWNSGEPNEANGEEDCVEMTYDVVAAGEWNDNACSKLNGYICQSYPDPSLNPPLVPISACRAGYSQYGTGCFKVISAPMKFSDANDECRRDNVYLTSIADQYEQAFVETLLHDNGGTPVWIGLVDDKVEGEYRWVDSWPVYFTHWGRSEPSKGAGEGCVAMETNGNWNDTRCSDMYSAVCKYSLETLPTDHPDTPGTCPDGWSPYGSNCYYFQPEGQNLVEWPVADFDCVSMGGQLASIHSKPENEFVRSNTKRTESMWIGLYRSDAGGFSWEDGTGVDFVNWAQDEPSWQWDGEHENCVELYLDRGEWNDLDCKFLKSYVCKMPKIPITGPPGQVTDAPPATNSGVTKSPQKSSGVSAGVIIGIILAVLVAVLLIALVACFLKSRSKTTKAPLDIGTVGFDNAMYSVSTEEVKVSDPTTINTASAEA